MHKPRRFLLIVNPMLILVPCRFGYNPCLFCLNYFCLFIFFCLPNKLYIIIIYIYIYIYNIVIYTIDRCGWTKVSSK